MVLFGSWRRFLRPAVTLEQVRHRFFTFIWALLLCSAVGFYGSVAAQIGPDAVVLSQEQGQRLAHAAVAYAEAAYVADGEERYGVPYLWGGRASLTAFYDAVAGGDGEGLEAVGVDASGLVVAALRDVFPNVRFFASSGGDVLWADATSALLHDYNAVSVEPSKLRAGDLVFFGERAEDGSTRVHGVGVVTGRSGTRVDFVVASAGQGRVVHTFARTDGAYWRDNVVAAGRLVLPGLPAD